MNLDLHILKGLRAHFADLRILKDLASISMITYQSILQTVNTVNGFLLRPAYAAFSGAWPVPLATYGPAKSALLVEQHQQ
jgi:hypothetical protein